MKTKLKPRPVIRDLYGQAMSTAMREIQAYFNSVMDYVDEAVGEISPNKVRCHTYREQTDTIMQTIREQNETTLEQMSGLPGGIPIKKFPRMLIHQIMMKNGGKTYRLGDLSINDISIHCLLCHRTSYSHGDVSQLFCLECGYHKDIMRDMFVPEKNPHTP